MRSERAGRATGEAPAEPPLVVDVDGSLIGGDLLIEGIARLLSVSPLSLFALPFRLAAAMVRGRAGLKRRIAEAAPLPPDTLAWNPAVLEEIAAAQAAGRSVWLASASDARAVSPLAETVGATGCLASDGRTNLAGEAKAAALVARFGERGFDYIGNERRDLAVWKRARRAIGVGLGAGLARKVRALDGEARFLPGLGGGPRDWFRALRPYQWVKNVLVFVPLVAAHETGAGPYLVAAGVFVALSAVASGAYLLNDLLDLPHDRGHPAKRRRPMAAGKVPLLPMIGLGAALAAGGLALAFWLSAVAGLWVLAYLAVTCAYSLSLKRKIFIDVTALAVLYAVRVLAGAAAVSVPLSPWLLAFFLFLFLALAIVKRQSELRALRGSSRSASGGRAYLAEDFPVVVALGAASGFASVVILTLYIQSPETGERYARPEFLWLICPLLLYWLGRMALLAGRGGEGGGSKRLPGNDDPLIFALRDRTSWLTGLVVLAAFAVAL